MFSINDHPTCLVTRVIGPNNIHWSSINQDDCPIHSRRLIGANEAIQVFYRSEWVIQRSLKNRSNIPLPVQIVSRQFIKTQLIGYQFPLFFSIYSISPAWPIGVFPVVIQSLVLLVPHSIWQRTTGLCITLSSVVSSCAAFTSVPLPRLV